MQNIKSYPAGHPHGGKNIKLRIIAYYYRKQLKYTYATIAKKMKISTTRAFQLVKDYKRWRWS